MTLTLPRECHAGLRGPDVLAYSRVYRRVGIRDRDQTRFFGVRMVGNTQHFQRDHGLHADGVVGPKTFDLLRKHFDAYDRWLIEREAKAIATRLNPRHLIVGAALALYNHRPFPYEEVRPYPSSLDGFYGRGSDCSGCATGCYHYAHLRFPNDVPDPNGMAFDGYGSTYYEAPRGNRTYSPKPGDLSFYYPTYSHVGVYLGNGRVFSHGKPGDPIIIPASWATMHRSYL